MRSAARWKWRESETKSRGDGNRLPGSGALEDQAQSNLHEALEARLAPGVAVDTAEVRITRPRFVLQLVVLRAVEEIERLETDLETNPIRDRRRLREVRVQHEQRGP